MDYTAVVDLLVQVVKQALPLGIIFCLTERLGINLNILECKFYIVCMYFFNI